MPGHRQTERRNLRCLSFLGGFRLAERPALARFFDRLSVGRHIMFLIVAADMLAGPAIIKVMSGAARAKDQRVRIGCDNAGARRARQVSRWHSTP